MPAHVKSWGHGALFLPPGVISNPPTPAAVLPCWRLPPRVHDAGRREASPRPPLTSTASRSPGAAALFKLPNFPKISHAQSRRALFYISAISAICPRPGISLARTHTRATGRTNPEGESSTRGHQNAPFYRPQNPQFLRVSNNLRNTREKVSNYLRKTHHAKRCRNGAQTPKTAHGRAEKRPSDGSNRLARLAP